MEQRRKYLTMQRSYHKDCEYCGSCGKVISTYEYKYNDQGYVVGETATELEAGTRKTPSWEDWYNWGDTRKRQTKQTVSIRKKRFRRHVPMNTMTTGN